MTGRLCTIDLTQPCSVIHLHNSNAQSKWDFMGTKCQKWICHLSEDSYLPQITIYAHTHLSTTSRPLQHVCCSTSISLSQSISGSSEKNHWYLWMEPSNSLEERTRQNSVGVEFFGEEAAFQHKVYKSLMWSLHFECFEENEVNDSVITQICFKTDSNWIFFFTLRAFSDCDSCLLWNF